MLIKLLPEREREAIERSVVVVVDVVAVVAVVADGSRWAEVENLPSWPQPLSEVPPCLAEEWSERASSTENLWRLSDSAADSTSSWFELVSNISDSERLVRSRRMRLSSVAYFHARLQSTKTRFVYYCLKKDQFLLEKEIRILIVWICMLLNAGKYHSFVQLNTIITLYLECNWFPFQPKLLSDIFPGSRVCRCSGVTGPACPSPWTRSPRRGRCRAGNVGRFCRSALWNVSWPNGLAFPGTCFLSWVRTRTARRCGSFESHSGSWVVRNPRGPTWWWWYPWIQDCPERNRMGFSLFNVVRSVKVDDIFSALFTMSDILICSQIKLRRKILQLLITSDFCHFLSLLYQTVPATWWK